MRKGKEMRKVIRISALIILLACSTQAGIMGNGSPEPPPPAPPATNSQGPTDGESTTSEAIDGETSDDTTDTLEQALLDLLAIWPSLL
jgi:hypothetical protein